MLCTTRELITLPNRDNPQEVIGYYNHIPLSITYSPSCGLVSFDFAKKTSSSKLSLTTVKPSELYKFPLAHLQIAKKSVPEYKVNAAHLEEDFYDPWFSTGYLLTPVEVVGKLYNEAYVIIRLLKVTITDLGEGIKEYRYTDKFFSDMETKSDFKFDIGTFEPKLQTQNCLLEQYRYCHKTWMATVPNMEFLKYYSTPDDFVNEIESIPPELSEFEKVVEEWANEVGRKRGIKKEETDESLLIFD